MSFEISVSESKQEILAWQIILPDPDRARHFLRAGYFSGEYQEIEGKINSHPDWGEGLGIKVFSLFNLSLGSSSDLQNTNRFLFKVDD